eukprot:IDg8972t1
MLRSCNWNVPSCTYIDIFRSKDGTEATRDSYDLECAKITGSDDHSIMFQPSSVEAEYSPPRSWSTD